MSDDHSRPTSGVASIALNVHEILCCIFEVGSDLGKDRRELLQCALVSHAFCEPALRTLWSNMSSPTPLWRLLVATVSIRKHALDFQIVDALFRQILSEKPYSKPSRWARFMWYARFVRELNVTSSGLAYEHKKIICTLISHNGGETIFPSLQMLWWPPSSYSDCSSSPLFTPRLRTAIFDFNRCTPRDLRPPDEDPDSHILLSRLRASSPRLDHLNFLPPLHHLGTDHSHLIASFEHLRTLHLSARISFASFRELVTIPCLETLMIFHVSLDDRKLEPSRPPPLIRAPHLARLSVGGDCPLLTYLFTALDAPVLASASVYAMWDDPPRTMAHGYIDYLSCIEALATVPTPPSLTDLTIELDEDGGPRMCEWLVDLLDPLGVFYNMARFSLSCPTVGLVAADDDFWLIAEAWPKLREFELRRAFWDPCVDPDDADSEGIPTPTPQVLECFREYCPDLRELRLPHLDVHADVPGLFTYVQKGRPRARTRPCHGLERLWFEAQDDTHAEDGGQESVELGEDKAVEWARYILHLFPKLNAEESLQYCGWSEAAAGWIEVFKRARDLRKTEEASSSGTAVVKCSRR